MLRKGTRELVHHSGLNGIACNDNVAECIEGLGQVFDLDEQAWQNSKKTVLPRMNEGKDGQGLTMPQSSHHVTPVPASKSCGITKAGAIDNAIFTLGTAAETQKPTAAPQFDTTSDVHSATMSSANACACIIIRPKLQYVTFSICSGHWMY